MGNFPKVPSTTSDSPKFKLFGKIQKSGFLAKKSKNRPNPSLLSPLGSLSEQEPHASTSTHAELRKQAASLWCGCECQCGRSCLHAHDTCMLLSAETNRPPKGDRSEGFGRFFDFFAKRPDVCILANNFIF